MIMMKNMYLIPTDKPSRLIHNDANQLCYQSNKSFKNDRKWMYRKKFNIYITSDEEIKEGDYGVIGEVIMTYSQMYKMWNATQGKKIILTTDQDLIKDGVQAIDDEFLEWFVKNPSCEEVDLDTFSLGNKILFNVVFPKEEPKQIKCYCGHTITCDCGPLEEPKQETLEEAAEMYADKQSDASMRKDPLEYSKSGEELWDEAKTDFIAGAKWQQERMYSEEEVRQLLSIQRGNCYVAILTKTNDTELASLTISAPEPKGKDGWVKQFKNK
jgi:hypothetical protein